MSAKEASGRDLDLPCFDSQWNSFFSTHLKAELNGFPDIFYRFIFCCALTCTARYGRTFRNPHTLFIPVNGY